MVSTLSVPTVANGWQLHYHRTQLVSPARVGGVSKSSNVGSSRLMD